MGTTVLRIILILLCSIGGYYVADAYLNSFYQAIWGVVIGLTISLSAVFLEKRITRYPLRAIVGGCTGLILGLIAANLLSYVFLLGLMNERIHGFLVHILINCVFGYIGIKIGSKKGEEFHLYDFMKGQKEKPIGDGGKILDTSVIIDGRIADICETGFIEGTFIVPQFILQELQHIADSSDSIKRTRGRRGLDILNKMQKQIDLEVKISEHDFPKIRDVDSKLVALGKELNAKIITNDFNLNKVAKLQGVAVLNINQLANALKPVVLPSEIMTVRILKEGKELGQGVAYLDDGTMVVVDNAKRYVGKNVTVTVTSVLQTTAGRMIFTSLNDEADTDNNFVHNLSY